MVRRLRTSAPPPGAADAQTLSTAYRHDCGAISRTADRPSQRVWRHSPSDRCGHISGQHFSNGLIDDFATTIDFDAADGNWWGDTPDRRHCTDSDHLHVQSVLL